MEIPSLDNLFTLLMLILLQAVLGFDNLLYISLESKRVEVSRQATLRKWGIGLAVVLRIVLLFVILKVVELFQESLFTPSFGTVFSADFNLHAIIVLFGGIFIIYTAIKEIMHMLIMGDLDKGGGAASSFARATGIDRHHESGVFFRFNPECNGAHQCILGNGIGYCHWRTVNDLAIR